MIAEFEKGEERPWRTFGDLHRRTNRHIHARNRWSGPLGRRSTTTMLTPVAARGLPTGGSTAAAPRLARGKNLYESLYETPSRNPLRKRLRKRFDGTSIRPSELERRHPLKMGRRLGHAASSP